MRMVMKMMNADENDSVDADDDELWMLVVFCLSLYNFLSHLASLPVIAP